MTKIENLQSKREISLWIILFISIFYAIFYASMSWIWFLSFFLYFVSCINAGALDGFLIKDREYFFLGYFIPIILCVLVGYSPIILQKADESRTALLSQIKEKEKKETIFNYIEKISPELLIKLTKLKKISNSIGKKIEKIKNLQSDFQSQKNTTQTAIDKLHVIHKKLLETQDHIFFEMEKSYVLFEINKAIGGVQDIDVLSKTLIKKAETALTLAKNVASTVDELQ